MNKILNKLNIKKSQKIMFLVLGLFLTITLLYTGISLGKKNKYDSSSLQKVNITDVAISEFDGLYTYQATLIAKENVSLDQFNIVLKDSSNNIIDTLIAYVGTTLDREEEFEIVSTTDTDLSNVAKIEYSMN